MKKACCRFVQGIGTIFLVLAVLKTQALAFPPMNDDFENAILLNGVSGQYSAFNSEATKQEGEPDHFGKPGGVSVWWTWTAEKKSIVRMDTVGSDFDTLLAVYIATAVDGLTEIISNDDGESVTSSEVSFTAQAGVPYAVVVDGYKGETGAITLNWEALEIPVNDNFADAILISGESGQVSENNLNASKEEGEPNHANNTGGASVWWKWTAPRNGSVTFHTNESEWNFFTLLAVYTGYNLGNLTLIGSDKDDVGSHNNEVTFDAEQDKTYYFAVDGNNGDTGQIVLSWSGEYSPPPINDNFADAIEIFGEEGRVTGSNINATNEAGEPAIYHKLENFRGNWKSVWWKWIAPKDGRVVICTKRSDFTTTIGCYSNNNISNFKIIARPHSESFITDNLTFQIYSGNEYYIKVEGTGNLNRQGQIVLEWRYELNLEKVYPNVGLSNQDLKINLMGSLFDHNTRVSMYLSDDNTKYSIDSVKIDGEISDVAVSGNRAYILNGIGLQIIDISNPENLKFLGSINTPGSALSLALSDNYAYIADYDKGLQIIDVSNDLNPQIVGYNDLIYYADKIKIYNNKGYVKTWEPVYLDSGGWFKEIFLTIFDINDPNNPTLLDKIEIGETFDFCVEDNLLYLVKNSLAKNYLSVLNIEIPSNPIELQKTDPYDSENSNNLYSIDILDNNILISTESDYDAYISYFLVLDKENVNSIPSGSLYDYFYYGYELMLTDSFAIQFISKGNWTINKYLEWDTEYKDYINLIDISTPTKPIAMGAVYLPNASILSDFPNEYACFDTDKNFLYLANNDSELEVIPLPVEIEIPQDTISENNIEVILPSPHIPGKYTIRVFNEDSYFEQPDAITFVLPDNKRLLDMRAIIIRGSKRDDDIINETKQASDRAYTALLEQGYTSESIYFISPEIDDEKVDNNNNFDNIREAINEWTKIEPVASQLILYMVGHGKEDNFIINENEVLNAETLNNWLNALQSELGIPVVVINDTCHSGSFISKLKHSLNSERFVITSTEIDKNAFFLDEGKLSFSHQFWTEILTDDELDDAFIMGKIQMQNYQSALLDANGNGVANETEDYFYASQFRIGIGSVSDKNASIISVSEPQIIYDKSWAVISADILQSSLCNRIYAVITPPDFMPGSSDIPITDLPVMDLSDIWLKSTTDNDFMEYYETYGNFSHNGEYKISIYADCIVFPEGQNTYLQFKDTTVIRESRYILTASAEPGILYSQNTAANIWAALNRKYAPESLTGVRAQITSPDNPPQMDEIVLSDPEDDGIYEAVYDRFTGDGTYEINIFATDVNGYSSPPVQIFLTHQNENLYPDVYESDDTFPAAGNFNISEIRHHSFHDSGDTDIVKNYLLKGTKYKVSVENPAPACDSVIQVFRTEGNLYIPVTDMVNAYGSGKNESTDIICPEKGSYYVILSNASQNFGPDITYDLKIIRPEAGIYGTIKGTVTAPSGMPIADAVITTDGGGSDMSRNDGSFSISDPVGNRVLTVETAGYDLYQLSLLLTESEPLFLHIILCPASVQAGDINADEVIDLRDALLALQISAGQADFSCAVCPKADVNSDERLGLAESIFVLQVAGGL